MIIVQAVSVTAALAAIVAGVLMANVTRKFGTGILAAGFKTISLGVFFIIGGIIVDAVTSYLQISDSTASTFVMIMKYVFFILGTYIIVNGSKKTSEKLESLTK